MHRFTLIFACLAVAVYPGWVCAASPNPADLEATPEVQVKTRVLVELLGSDDYDEREDAEEQLAELGRLARPALLAGVNTHPSPEVRQRCARLLPKANILDLKARIETFLADTKGEYEHDLPAWKEFRATACSEWSMFGQVVWSNHNLEKASREIFTEIISSPDNRRVMIATMGSRVELSELSLARRQLLYNQRSSRTGDTPARGPTLEDITTLLFAETYLGSQYLPRRGSISTLLNSSGFYNAARGTDEKSQVYRAIAAAWLNTRDDPREMYQAMSIASNFELNDVSCMIAARLFTMPSVTATYRARAASTIINYGKKRHISLLETAFNNKQIVYSFQGTNVNGGYSKEIYEVQLRDMALVLSIRLAKQTVSDFGFSENSNPENFDFVTVTYSRYYFRDDDARKAAFAKWAEWRKVNE